MKTSPRCRAVERREPPRKQGRPRSLHHPVIVQGFPTWATSITPAAARFLEGAAVARTELIFSPVFHKHPNLKVAFSEGGVGWMPYLMERADYVWRKHKYYQNIHPTVKPSELFQRNIAGCFIEDEVGIADRHRIGVYHITWECDYPHSDSFWPKSRARAEEMFADVPDDEVHQMVELNTPDAGTRSRRRGSRRAPPTPAGGPTAVGDRTMTTTRVMAGHTATGFQDFMEHLEEARAEAERQL